MFLFLSAATPEGNIAFVTQHEQSKDQVAADEICGQQTGLGGLVSNVWATLAGDLEGGTLPPRRLAAGGCGGERLQH